MIEFKLFLGDFKLPLGDINTERGYFNLLDLPFYKDFLNEVKDKSVENIRSSIEAHAKLCKTSDKWLQLIVGGVGFLNLFIQKNWTGPDIAVNEELSQLIGFNTGENILKQLVVNGENVISVVELPELLFLSKTILEICEAHFKTSNIVKIWYIRCLFIHQQILEEFSEELFKKITIAIDEVRKSLNDLPKAETVLYYLEFARIYMYYQNVQKSKTDVTKATEHSGIKISLSGALGKRTKYQNQNLAQLILKIDLGMEETLEKSIDRELHSTVPRDVKLDDEVRLDKVKYADNANNKYPDLTEVQQAVVLANLFQIQKSQPKDSLADEELEPLINCIVDQSGIWSMRMTALLLRSKLEATHKRTVERAMLQIQVLSDCLKNSEISLEQRLNYFFVSHLVPKWEIQSSLANILLSLGSIKSALEIYENLKDWENIIYCYNALQLRHRAQEIIEQELNKNPSPKLWCLLGDATDDVSCYEKAWELSNNRSARAQRHWAYFYYFRRKYAECIQHFQKSLEINSLQKGLWYRLGYAALMEEKWEISAHAYRRYCVLDPECFEAWNNLARCYCELKQKYRAWRALQEALKVDYSNWKVWDNYMLVSSDVRAFDEVIKSYHEILNIKEKHLDIPVLNSLVVGFKEFKEEEENETGKIDRKNFRGKLLELFGRLTSQVGDVQKIINDSELWFLYSEVVEADTSENTTKKYQLLLKAYRSAINKPQWETNLEKCNKIIYILSKMVEVGLQTGKSDIFISCKLAASGALVKIKKAYPDAGFCEDLERNMTKLDEILS